MKIARVMGFPAGLGLLAWAVVAWAPAASAVTSHCMIMNPAADASYASLQAAQDAAAAGATLRVRGMCTGVTEITKNLTVTGQPHRGFTAPTLNGGGLGSVLTVDVGVTLTVNTLTITGGAGSPGNDGDGGGIFNSGTLTLNDSSITGNAANVSSGGLGGGGIFNVGTLTLNGSSIAGNTTTGGGGGLVANLGTVTLNGSSITGNTAAGQGGGIFLLGELALTGSSSITGNTANAAGASGGGIYNNNIGGVTGATATNITGNTPDNCAPPGTVSGCVG